MKAVLRTRIYGKLAIWGLTSLSLTGFYACKTTQTTQTYQITSGGENLQALTKVTDRVGIHGTHAGGGYDSESLFITLSTSSNENIYKKELTNSPAMIQVTFGDYDCHPCYCVSIDKFAFSQYRGGQRDIYLVPSKGSYLIPVTETPNYNEFFPSFSKDGVYLAYQRCIKNGNVNDISSEIWVKNLTTGENMLLGSGCAPKISPDGKKIAYAKFENLSVRHIWVMDLDGSNAMQLTDNATEFAGFPCWSPDGKYIVFQNIIRSKKADFDLYIVSNDGTGLMQITTNAAIDMSPYWSADNFIYFTSDRGDAKGNYQIWKFKPFE